MTYSNADLVRRFAEGESTGKASNMEIVETDGGDRAIVGYGHAVYALSAGDDRFDDVVFVGWSGASSSTTQHIAECKRRIDSELDSAPKLKQITDDVTFDYLDSIPANEQDYGGYGHGRLRGNSGRGGI